MKLSKIMVGMVAVMAATSVMAGAADYPMPAYANHAVYPAALMSQGFFVNIDGIYTKEVLTSGTVLNDANQTPVSFNEPWGFAGNLGYQMHFGKDGSMIAGLEGGYAYLGRLTFAGTSSTPKPFKLQMGTGLIDLGMQMGQLDVIAKGGVAVEIGGHYQTSDDYTTTLYRFATRVVPMAGAEVGFTVMPNLKISAQVNYIFGHKLDASNMGTASYQAASGGYKALSGMVGLTYYMN